MGVSMQGPETDPHVHITELSREVNRARMFTLTNGAGHAASILTPGPPKR